MDGGGSAKFPDSIAGPERSPPLLFTHHTVRPTILNRRWHRVIDYPLD